MSQLTDRDTTVEVSAVRVHLFRAKVARPMLTSFGVLAERPALLLEIESADGVHGWGEVWCNFPALVEEHRRRFTASIAAPMLVGKRFAEPSEAVRLLDAALGIQAIQAAEEGTLASVAAGVDQALWDLVARRHGEPLWRLLGGRQSVRVYASGIEPEHAARAVAESRAQGHTAFKLKVGFDDGTDVRALKSVREEFGDEVELMADANQAWTVRHAVEVAQAMAEAGLIWLEEPIRATEPVRVWRELSQRTPIPLAAGENIRAEGAFNELVTTGAIRHVQPDVGKWGGLSGCVALGRWVVGSAQATYSPHWVGGGVGLAHSLHALAAVGGEGRAELDVTPNPLRDLVFCPAVRDGVVILSDAPGIGFEPDLDSILEYRTSAPDHG